AFCHWAYVGAGGAHDNPVVVDAGAALELLHTFALVHDDVMDGSNLRRGLPAIHRRFMTRHDVQRWRGEARRYGEGAAILVGDFGDAAITGKPVGDDLREGKLTPLVAAAAARATGSAARRLQNLGRSDLDDAEIAGLQAVLVDTGAVDEVERSIERLVEQALEALAVAPIAPEARVGLEELGTFVAWRDR